VLSAYHRCSLTRGQAVDYLTVCSGAISLCGGEKKEEEESRDGMAGGASPLLGGEGAAEGACTSTNKMATLVAREQFQGLGAKGRNTTGDHHGVPRRFAVCVRVGSGGRRCAVWYFSPVFNVHAVFFFSYTLCGRGGWICVYPFGVSEVLGEERRGERCEVHVVSCRC